MRTAQIASVGVFAVGSMVAFGACKGDAPTGVRTASVDAVTVAATRSPSAAPLVLPPVGAFSSELLSRGVFVDDVNVLFRIKENHATAVVNVDTPSDMVMSRITIPANTSLPWHSHVQHQRAQFLFVPYLRWLALFRRPRHCLHHLAHRQRRHSKTMRR